MFPPRVSAAHVRSVIREFTVEDRLPSGVRVRSILSERFGSPGGVSRIYRLLAEEGSRRAPPPDPHSVEVLQREAQSMRERAERAEAREESHQTRWAEEIDRLRLKVASLEPLARQAQMLLETTASLQRQVRAAEQRASRLEEQLEECQRRGPRTAS